MDENLSTECSCGTSYSIVEHLKSRRRKSSSSTGVRRVELGNHLLHTSTPPTMSSHTVSPSNGDAQLFSDNSCLLGNPRPGSRKGPPECHHNGRRERLCWRPSIRASCFTDSSTTMAVLPLTSSESQNVWWNCGRRTRLHHMR